MTPRRTSLFFTLVKKSLLLIFCQAIIATFANLVQDSIYLLLGGTLVGIIIPILLMRLIRVIIRLRIMIAGIVKMLTVTLSA